MENTNLGPYRTAGNIKEPKVPLGGTDKIDFSNEDVSLYEGRYIFLVKDVKADVDYNAKWCGLTIKTKIISTPIEYKYLINVDRKFYIGKKRTKMLFLSCKIYPDKNGYLYKEDLIEKKIFIRINSDGFFIFEGDPDV